VLKVPKVEKSINSAFGCQNKQQSMVRGPNYIVLIPDMPCNRTFKYKLRPILFLLLNRYVGDMNREGRVLKTNVPNFLMVVNYSILSKWSEKWRVVFLLYMKSLLEDY
jgi:hypothetical protein